MPIPQASVCAWATDPNLNFTQLQVTGGSAALRLGGVAAPGSTEMSLGATDTPLPPVGLTDEDAACNGPPQEIVVSDLQTLLATDEPRKL